MPQNIYDNDAFFEGYMKIRERACNANIRSNFWIVENVIKYHRTMGEIVTTLAKKGFFIEFMDEPAPEKEVLEKYPALKEDLLKPDFLMIRARKISV